MTGVEPATLCLASTRSSQLSYTRVMRGGYCTTAKGSVNGALAALETFVLTKMASPPAFLISRTVSSPLPPLRLPCRCPSLCFYIQNLRQIPYGDCRF